MRADSVLRIHVVQFNPSPSDGLEPQLARSEGKSRTTGAVRPTFNEQTRVTEPGTLEGAFRRTIAGRASLPRPDFRLQPHACESPKKIRMCRRSRICPDGRCPHDPVLRSRARSSSFGFLSLWKRVSSFTPNCCSTQGVFLETRPDAFEAACEITLKFKGSSREVSVGIASGDNLLAPTEPDRF